MRIADDKVMNFATDLKLLSPDIASGYKDNMAFASAGSTRDKGSFGTVLTIKSSESSLQQNQQEKSWQNGSFSVI